MTEKRLGKISKVIFGKGGYQDAQFGIWFVFEFDGCIVTSGHGVWGGSPSERSKWTLESKKKEMSEIMLYIEELMTLANVTQIQDLKGVPVEVTLTDNKFDDFRILTEVI
jgi:hypothetical protein